MSEISPTLLKQRLRNRIIESLGMFADAEAVCLVGTGEIINFWYDYVDDEWQSFYDLPVFSSEELHSIQYFHNLLESSYKKVPSSWDLGKLSNNNEWSALVTAAREQYAIFLERGLFSEEEEII